MAGELRGPWSSSDWASTSRTPWTASGSAWRARTSAGWSWPSASSARSAATWPRSSTPSPTPCASVSTSVARSRRSAPRAAVRLHPHRPTAARSASTCTSRTASTSRLLYTTAPGLRHPGGRASSCWPRVVRDVQAREGRGLTMSIDAPARRCRPDLPGAHAVAVLIGVATSERRGVARSVAAIQALDSAPRRAQGSSSDRSPSGSSVRSATTRRHRAQDRAGRHRGEAPVPARHRRQPARRGTSTGSSASRSSGWASSACSASSTSLGIGLAVLPRRPRHRAAGRASATCCPTSCSTTPGRSARS